MQRPIALGSLATLLLLSGCQTYHYQSDDAWNPIRPHHHSYQTYYGTDTGHHYYHYPEEGPSRLHPYTPPAGNHAHSVQDHHGIRVHIGPDQQYDYPSWVEEDDYRPWPYSDTLMPRYHR